MQLPDAAPMSIWPPILAVAGPGDASGRHSHHALHAVIARRGALRARVAGTSREGAGILTGPDVEHAIDARGSEVVILFVDPGSVPGASLIASFTGDATMLDTGVRDQLVVDLATKPRSSELEAWASSAVTTLTRGEWRRPQMHPRVRRLIRDLGELPPDAETSLDALARRAGLSPSRLMHVFTESVGIPIRPYLRWLRVQRAATAIVTGAPLSHAASDAGFADAAHMSRTFKRMFGLSPSALQRRSGNRQR